MTDTPLTPYGTRRKRTASVSHAEIETVARHLMATGGYPSVAAVRKELKRGSSTTIAEGMRRFWKNQAALDGGNPVAMTRLPPQFADAVVTLWEQALTLSQQTAQHDDNAARERLQEIEVQNDLRAHSLTLREQAWEAAARERERALADAREHLLSLSKALAREQATNQAHERRIAALETEVAQYRQQMGALIADASADMQPQQRWSAPKGAKHPSLVRTSPRSKRPIRENQMPRPRKAEAASRPQERHPRNSPGKTPGGKPR